MGGGVDFEPSSNPFRKRTKHRNTNTNQFSPLFALSVSPLFALSSSSLFALYVLPLFAHSFITCSIGYSSPPLLHLPSPTPSYLKPTLRREILFDFRCLTRRRSCQFSIMVCNHFASISCFQPTLAEKERGEAIVNKQEPRGGGGIIENKPKLQKISICLCSHPTSGMYG